mmetsp:Transcript_16975/g.39180  ORF Transcript_16975/g.39180 Transcript_16975/m.39180 type:complete len:432 (+) Transcript_16975:54-1349(+)|eukprot:CAMPEP_0172586436 /NCGR_PEP_ID=MMETSP1068-20121228/5810_1 /TAXON_ID=35684 /ORGANISM="Pseudopedinella elastica, Strain CCMP716" /LENGTH=431 /DNA_ID=CAMNT_0013381249 /DNA_START=53 /DNA_END=1348 /DNA_ORIENTATION=+
MAGSLSDSKELVTHQLSSNGKVRGALAIGTILGCMGMGPLLPLLCTGLFAAGWTLTATAATGMVVASMIFAQHSPRWCRFYLNAAGYFEKGVFLHIERRAIKAMKESPSMWCMHPHGTSIGFGFSLNGEHMGTGKNAPRSSDPMDDMDERSDGSRQTGSANPAKIHYLFRDLHRNRKSKGKSKSREERPLRDAERNSEELFVFMFSNERRLLCIGAVRFRAEDEATYLPKELLEGIGLERLRKADGVQAPVLFRLPLLRSALLGFGCATPATKAAMATLFERRIDFGILPGGMEEVALYTKGRERVFLKKRAGFIKYALQHGYLVQPAYTFGECDLYTSLTAGASGRLWMLRNLGFVVPVFWGPHWWAPWLPRADVPLHTVVGEPLQLPCIPAPTKEDVAHWHGKYIECLTLIFETHKGRFGYQSRSLEVV